MTAFEGFTPKAFTFLRGLARHNEKEWFEAHRPQYEGDLRKPMVALVDEMDARFGTEPRPDELWQARWLTGDELSAWVERLRCRRDRGTRPAPHPRLRRGARAPAPTRRT